MVGKSKQRKRLDSMGRRIDFAYQKSNLHRVIKVDGAWGGIVPEGIMMSVFSEIKQFPLSETYQLDEDGRIAVPIKSTGKQNSIVREIEATLVMSPRTAKSLMEWLKNKIDSYEEASNEFTDEETLEKDKLEDEVPSDTLSDPNN